MQSRLLSPASATAAILLTLLCALTSWSGVSQQWFEWVHPPDTYARALVRDAHWLHAIRERAGELVFANERLGAFGAVWHEEELAQEAGLDHGDVSRAIAGAEERFAAGEGLDAQERDCLGQSCAFDARELLQRSGKGQPIGAAKPQDRRRRRNASAPSANR